MSALDRVLDSLERRYERRRKACARAREDIAYRTRTGEHIDLQTWTNYHRLYGRADEARLALNAALAVDAETRRQP